MNYLKKISFVGTAVLVLALVFASNATATILNPSFEATPDLTGWTVTTTPTGGSYYNVSVTVDRSGSYATDGTAAARLYFDGSTGLAYGTMWGPSIQSSDFLASASDTLSLYISLFGTGDYGLARAFLRDATTDTIVQTIFSTGTYGHVAGTYGVTIATAGNYYLDIQSGSYDATGGWYVGSNLYIDNIQASLNPVPEPSTLLLVGSGLVGLARAKRKFGKQ